MKKFYSGKFLGLLLLGTAFPGASTFGQVTLQTFSYTGAIQQFTVPQLCVSQMTIEAIGASGGSVNVSCTGNGGLGASMKGVVSVTPGQVISILVGQVGFSNGSDAGGGGGSFVVAGTNTPLMIAGGGGGASNNIGSCGSFIHGVNASTTTAGTANASNAVNGGTNGNGGSATGGSGSAGGGLLTDGMPGSGNPNGAGKAFVNGGAGGTGFNNNHGGFGGGGCGWHTGGNGGGGGGYSGGGTLGSSPYWGGGGGGSFNAGTNQVNIAGANSGNGLVRIWYETGTPITVNSSTNEICVGASVNITASGAVTYTWTGQPNPNVTQISVSPAVTTAYTVAGTNTANCISTQVVTVTVHQLPTVSGAVTPTLLCVGDNATLTAFGGATYSWGGTATDQTLAVNPSVNTSYNFTATSVKGCESIGSVMVNVNTNTLTITSTTAVCMGNPAHLSASGAVSYNWNTGAPFPAITVTPATNTMYFVNATDANGCALSNSVQVNVNPKPTVSASANKSTICRGEKVTLTASGADTYVWNEGETTASVTYTPLVDVPYTYTVTGTNSNNCSNKATVSITVSKCVGISEINSAAEMATFFPNPGNGALKVSLSNVPSGSKLVVYNATGALITSKTALQGENQVDLSSQADGIYFVHLMAGEQSLQIQKFIKK